ncbi:MAG: LysM peptidoglycan-binding domain-containing protein [Myxococcota bacterium]
MRWHLALLSFALAALPCSASAEPQVHTVAPGQVLGKIAKRYNVSIEAVCNANGISRREKLRPGQRLLIPDPDDKDGSRAAEEQNVSPAAAQETPKPSGALQELELEGGRHRAFYYEPTGPGRLGMRPVLVYLHGRGGHPEQDCKRWASVARNLGWLVCPSGPSPYGSGRAWDNNWPSAHQITMSAIQALRARYGRRVQLYGNTLVGFSEGAYAAMNVGVREPRAFNRWLILAANTRYWGGPGLEALDTARERVRRVYLITGEHDEVVEGTRQVESWLRKARVTTRISIPKDMGHELALDRKPFLYAQALRWLNGLDKKRDVPVDDSEKTASR